MTELSPHRSAAGHRHVALRCTIDAAQAAEAGHPALADALALLARCHHDLADAVSMVVRCGLDDLALARDERMAS